MNAISQSDFLQALGWAVLNSLWQMALLWVAYQILTALFPISRSGQKASLASALLFAGFTWFVFTFLIILEKNPQAAGYVSLVNITSNNDALNKWFAVSLPWASLCYLVLLAAPLINFIRNYRYVQQLRGQGLSKASVECRMFVQKLSAHMGIRRTVKIWMSELVSSPVTIGYLKPVILLPLAAVNNLSTPQLEAILLHELAHIKRMDYITNLFTRIIQTILYFNPFVKAFARIVEQEREKSCDEMVIQFEYEPHGYATALLVLEKASQAGRSKALAIAATSGERKSELRCRIESILGIQKKNGLSFHKIAGVLSALLCFIGLNALVILSKPGKSSVAPGFFLSQLSSPLSFVPEDNTTVVVPSGNDRPAVAKVDQSENSGPSESPEITPGKKIPSPASSAIAKSSALSNIVTSLPGGVDEEFINKVVANATDHFVQASSLQSIIPVLTPQQENQVKEALDASKKVMEVSQWKALEKNIADVMTVAEKEKVKAAYERAAEKANWDKMADQLRLAYDQINWTDLNSELNNAIVSIKLDSLRQVYSLAMTELDGIQKEMVQNGLKGIPDSDITLDVLKKRISDLQKARTKVQALRTRKVIDL